MVPLIHSLLLLLLLCRSRSPSLVGCGAIVRRQNRTLRTHSTAHSNAARGERSLSHSGHDRLKRRSVHSDNTVSVADSLGRLHPRSIPCSLLCLCCQAICPVSARALHRRPRLLVFRCAAAPLLHPLSPPPLVEVEPPSQQQRSVQSLHGTGFEMSAEIDSLRPELNELRLSNSCAGQSLAACIPTACVTFSCP